MNWYNGTVGDLITLQRGYDLPDSERKAGNIPVIGSAGPNGFHSEAKAKGPGVTVGRSGGSIGKVTYVPQDFWPHNACLFVKDFKGNDPRFIAYLLGTLHLAQLNSGAAQPSLNRNYVHDVRLHYPDALTQTRIASILSAYDDLIENNRRRIDLLEQSARLLYKEWFVSLRFPGHEHVKVKDGVPAGWEVSTVAEVCNSFDDGDWIETKDQGGEDYRLLQISNIGMDDFVETGNFRYVTDDTFRRLHCNEVKPGDILISRMPDPIGRAWYVTKQPWKMITAVDATIARPNHQAVNPFYYLYHINSPSHLALCAARATGATRPRVARKNMGALPIKIPPLILQNEFGETAKSIHQMKATLRRQINQLTRARDLLLPRLMNGEIPV